VFISHKNKKRLIKAFENKMFSKVLMSLPLTNYKAQPCLALWKNSVDYFSFGASLVLPPLTRLVAKEVEKSCYQTSVK